jgi:hypothetical protein
MTRILPLLLLLSALSGCKPKQSMAPMPPVAPDVQQVAPTPTPPPAVPPPIAPTVSVLELAPPASERPGYQRPLLIDFHTHLSLDGQERIQRIMRENGIEFMVNLSGGSYRRGPEQWLQSKILSDALGGRVLNFMNPDWSGFGQANWGKREAGRLDEAVTRYEFRGLKIAKVLGLGAVDENNGQLVAVDDPRLNLLWQKCGDLGVPVTIHVADPRAFWWPLDPQNERWDELKVHPGWAYGSIPPELAAELPVRPKPPSWPELLQAAERMYRANPRTVFIAVHFGNAAEDLDYVDGLLTRNDNVNIDLAARVGEFGRHPVAKLQAFFSKWQDRIVFGTDIGIGSDFLMLGSNGAVEPQMPDVRPFYEAHFRFLETAQPHIAHPSPIQGNWTVDAIDLPAPILQKIYRDNALRLLDRTQLKAFAARQMGDTSKLPIGVPDGAQPGAKKPKK